MVTSTRHEELPLFYKNRDLEHIVTPVKGKILQDMLLQAGYDKTKTEYLVKGFTKGFKLNYQGNLKNVKRLAPNLKLRVGSPCELWNQVMKEVELSCFVGPFEKPPFEYFVPSPIGLCPKIRD